MQVTNTTKEGIKQTLDFERSVNGELFLSITNVLDGQTIFTFIEVKGMAKNILLKRLNEICHE